MRELSLLGVLLLIAAACGSGDGIQDDGGGTAVPSATEAPAPADDGGAGDASTAPTTVPTVDAGDVEDFLGEGTATVTLNGETYYFGDAGFPAIQCMPDFFGVMIGFLQRVDESGAEIAGGGGLQFALLLPGTDPEVVDQLNEMAIDLADLDQEWTANEEHIELFELEPGTSQVDSVSFDGNTATGTGTVYEETTQEVSEATFEVTCADG